MDINQQSEQRATVAALMKGIDDDDKNFVMASDAFFPFPDGIELAHKYGASIIIQPGGSINDNKVIECADKLGIVMMFTNTRHFLH